MRQPPRKRRLSERDYEFMNSLSAAVLQVTPRKLRLVLFFWIAAVALFLIWAAFAEIDEIARGQGEVIPSGQNQMVQNLEGGIVDEILVREGEHVEKGQVLLKIDNQKSESSFTSSEIKSNALEAGIVRLEAEANNRPFQAGAEMERRFPDLVANEQRLYLANKRQLDAKLNALNEQLIQRRQELEESKTRREHLDASLSLIRQEVAMTEPMVAKGVRSKVDFLKLQREANEIDQQYNATLQAIPRLESAVKEVEQKIEETRLGFRSDAQGKLNEAVAELQGLRAGATALEDQVNRTLVRSPMKGIVQTLFIHTVGGVVKPGADLVEVVPSDETLLVEVKIKPSDIAFIYYGQKAIVKFSAYDFAIFGALDGRVVHISADTVTDRDNNTFYTVRIKTDKNYLGSEDEPLSLIPGMTANADIITGKKTILDYILKPILKTKQYTFTER